MDVTTNTIDDGRAPTGADVLAALEKIRRLPDDRLRGANRLICHPDMKHRADELADARAAGGVPRPIVTEDDRLPPGNIVAFRGGDVCAFIQSADDQ